MTHAKIRISIFIMVCLFSSFAFGKQTKPNQPIFNVFEVKPFDFRLLEHQSLNSKSDVSEKVAYEQLFRIIISFEKQAEKLESEGKQQRAEFLRDFLQTKARLSREQSNTLKTYAKSFTTEIGQIKNRYKMARQAKTESLFQFDKSERERNQLFLEYRNRLRKFFGENSFENFAKFVQEKIASRMTYGEDLTSQRVMLSMSMVEYNETSDEVLGYSFTDEPGGHDDIVNIVSATLNSDSEGVVDSDFDEQCNQAAEVYLFVSGTNAEETFCVDGSHEYAIAPIQWITGRPENRLTKTIGKANYGGCYGYEVTEDLPASEDCLTTPQLPNVTSVNFELIQTGNTTIDTNPNAGGGQRIFPDDDTPGDTVNRQLIRVTAQISENRAGLRVYFGNYDLDDPSTDMTIDPNGNAGDDNNGEVGGNRAGQLSPVSAVTNSTGVATVNFTVTRQPGDNFAVATSTTQTEIASITVNGTDLTGGSGTVQTNCDETDAVCRTEMLTVWRRLYIEADSMGEVQNNFVDGTFNGSYIVGTSDTVVEVNPPSLETGRFEGGRLVFGSTVLQVITNTANTLTVRSSFGMVTVSPGNSFRLYDDDDFNDDDGSALNGDTGDEIPRPDTSLLSISDVESFNVFAPAYIRPAQRPTGGKNEDVPFAANTGETEITNLFNTYFDNQATEADVEFWTVYLLGGYQFRTNRDGDPYTLVRGNLTTVWGAADTGERQTVGRGAILFTEDGRAREYPSDWASRPVSRAHTVAHEVGHLFGCIHADGGLMADTTRRTSGSLPPPCLNQIRRNATHP